MSTPNRLPVARKIASGVGKQSAGSSGYNSSASAASLTSVPVNDVDKASVAACEGSVRSASESVQQAPPAPFAGIVAKVPLPVLYHTDLRGHDTRLLDSLEVHQEGPDRVYRIMTNICEDAVVYNLCEILYDNQVPLATREQLLRVHDPEYVDFLEGLCVRYDSGPNHDHPSDHEVLRFSPLVVSRLFDEDEKRRYFGAEKHLSSATRFSPGSYKATMRSAGAVVRAVNLVMDENTKQNRAFCLVRPPGHHAGPRGYDPTAGGCGFCLVNNVMVGVAECLANFPDCRIAVVDIDVHHGNGTQAIIESKFKDQAVMFCSTHLFEVFEGDPDQDFFPGTGGERDDEQILNIPLVPLWTQKDSDKNRDNSKKRTKKNSSQEPKAKRTKGADGGIFLEPEPLLGRLAFRHAIENRVLPKLQRFKPDLIVMSTGFDGAFMDEGNLADHHAGLDLTEADFTWATDMIVSRSGAKKIVSVLEGGYGRWSPNLNMYDTAPLVSCCLAHIAALIET